MSKVISGVGGSFFFYNTDTEKYNKVQNSYLTNSYKTKTLGTTQLKNPTYTPFLIATSYSTQKETTFPGFYRNHFLASIKVFFFTQVCTLKHCNLVFLHTHIKSQFSFIFFFS